MSVKAHIEMTCKHCRKPIYSEEDLLLHSESKLRHCDPDFDDMIARNQKMAEFTLVVEKVTDEVSSTR